jgi:hypothetical protein
VQQRPLGKTGLPVSEIGYCGLLSGLTKATMSPVIQPPSLDNGGYHHDA